jgi:hypothetical protein
MTFGGAAPSSGNYNMIVVTNPYDTSTGAYNIWGTDTSGNRQNPMNLWANRPTPTGDTPSQAGTYNVDYVITVP